METGSPAFVASCRVVSDIVACVNVCVCDGVVCVGVVCVVAECADFERRFLDGCCLTRVVIVDLNVLQSGAYTAKKKKMDKSHTMQPFDPLVSNHSDTDDNAPIPGPTRLVCKCVASDAHDLLRVCLVKLSKHIDDIDTLCENNNHTLSSDVKARQKKIKASLTLIQKAQKENKVLIKQHRVHQQTFAQQTVEQIKRHAINVPPNRPPLKMKPWRVGEYTPPKPSATAFLRRNAPPTIPVDMHSVVHDLCKTPDEKCTP